MRNLSALHGLRVATLTVAIFAAGVANALTLADLNAGASFTSVDGSLTFDDFSVSIPATIGSSANAFLGLDLALIEVEALPTNGFGFRVIEFDAPLVAVGDEVGQLVIGFRVSASPAFVIDGADIRFTGTALGTGAITQIEEVISTPDGDVTLTAIRLAGGVQSPIDSVVFASPAASVDVSTTITLDTRGRTAFLAQLSEFEPGFSARPVPEPGAIALFAGSMALVLTASRRRWL